ncbi:MAG: hypothetical protein Ct9H300mP13_1520 [Gammaproteobacteria bacterium]|nr:MAG: hypothetical protein Ct9H300mP13_1520 [Gammaproteobacteria bacterium]
MARSTPQIGDAIAHLMGAGQGNVLVCDNTTVNLYKILTYAWHLVIQATLS